MIPVFSTSLIPADGTSLVTITDIAAGSTIRVALADQPESTPIFTGVENSGTAELTFDTPGRYQVVITGYDAASSTAFNARAIIYAI